MLRCSPSALLLLLLLVLGLAGAAAAGAAAAAAAADGADEPLFLFLFTPRCYDVFLTNGLFSLNFVDIWDLPCIKITVSKGLSLAIILGSVLVKAPQIFNIVSNADVRGLSPSAFYLDTLGYLLSPVYFVRTVSAHGRFARAPWRPRGWDPPPILSVRVAVLVAFRTPRSASTQSASSSSCRSAL